jgi:hypothetical protein
MHVVLEFKNSEKLNLKFVNFEVFSKKYANTSVGSALLSNHFQLRIQHHCLPSLKLEFLPRHLVLEHQ